MPAPPFVSPLFCTDENIAVREPDDFVALCPASNVLAAGTDGQISAGTPWLLASASVDFLSLGVQSQGIVQLKPGGKGTGTLYAIDAVATGQLTLRRPGLALNVGQPPGVGGLTGIVFTVYTYIPQIEELSYDLRQRYGINDAYATTSATFMYDQRVIRRLCVAEVLYDRYTAANRTSDGDWAAKIKQLDEELEELRDRVSIRWGPQGNSAPPSNVFGRTFSR